MRNISLLLKNGTEKDVFQLKEFCKNNNIDFIFRYGRDSSRGVTRMEETDTIPGLYYFYIVSDTEGYNKLLAEMDNKPIPTDYAEICNVNDGGDAFEQKLIEVISQAESARIKMLSADKNLIRFLKDIENIDVLNMLYNCYSGRFTERQREFIRDRIDILSGNRNLIDEEMTEGFKSLQCNVKELREKTGMSRREFCKYMYNIPYRTVEDWEAGKSTCSTYLYNMMSDRVDEYLKNRME